MTERGDLGYVKLCAGRPGAVRIPESELRRVMTPMNVERPVTSQAPDTNGASPPHDAA
jgi:hypothetical protein